MNEKEVERQLVIKAKLRGGMAFKFISPGNAGVPDRIVLMPGGHIAFVELKKPGGRMRPLQVKVKAKLESLGFRVYCLDNPEKIKEALDEISGNQ